RHPNPTDGQRTAVTVASIARLAFGHTGPADFVLSPESSAFACDHRQQENTCPENHRASTYAADAASCSWDGDIRRHHAESAVTVVESLAVHRRRSDRFAANVPVGARGTIMDLEVKVWHGGIAAGVHPAQSMPLPDMQPD